MSKTHLSHKHHHTLQQIFQHPASHNLEWREVISLVRQLGSVEEQSNGHLIFTHADISETFSPTKGKDVAEVQQILDIRHFMEKAGVLPDGTMSGETRTEAQGASTEKEEHAHDRSHVTHDQNQKADQQIKTQDNEQHQRNAILPGNAQAHQQGNRQS